MKTVKLNVFAEQRKWMEDHRNAHHTICNAKGEAVQAVYLSPLEQWRGRIAPDGTVDVPDMDYYNSLTLPQAIEEAIGDIFPRDDNFNLADL